MIPDFIASFCQHDHTEIQTNCNPKINMKGNLTLREPETNMFTKLDQILNLFCEKSISKTWKP
jgi:hypothetical protein